MAIDPLGGGVNQCTTTTPVVKTVPSNTMPVPETPDVLGPPEGEGPHPGRASKPVGRPPTSGPPISEAPLDDGVHAPSSQPGGNSRPYSAPVAWRIQALEGTAAYPTMKVPRMSSACGSQTNS